MDTATTRLVALIVGAVVLITIIGAFALLLTDRPVDATVIGLGGTALGYLAGLLTPNGSQEVRVVNAPSEPVPVDPAGP
jgi:hypothetical protein